MSEFQLSSDARDRLLKWMLKNHNDAATIAMIGAALRLNPTEMHKGHFVPPKKIISFGPCYELLREVPELRYAFPLVAEEFPEFKPVLDNIDKMIALFESDSTECYRRLCIMMTCNCRKITGRWKGPWIGTWRTPQ